MNARHSRDSSTEKVSEEYFRERYGSTTLESFDFVHERYNRTKIKFGFEEKVGSKGPESAIRKSDNLRNPFKSSSRSIATDLNEPTPSSGSNHTTTLYAFGRPSGDPILDNENTAGSFEFAPSLSFDDLQQSIVTTNEPQLSEFPAPGGGGGIILGKGILGGMKNDQESGEKASISVPASSGNAVSSTRLGRSGSILRRPSLSSRQTSQTSSTSSMDPPTAPLAMRTRRQSNVTSNGVAPRKSIGPGALGTDFVERARQRQRPSFGGNAGAPVIHGGDATGVMTLTSASGTIANPTEGPKHLTTSRSLKAKSLQPPPRQEKGHLATPSMTPDHARSSFVTNSKSPGKSPARRTNTPSSGSSKRISTVPMHATGLGARTISPTDARRLKRMSTLQHPPPVPTTPPTPQPELLASTRSAAQSPSMIPRKSVTPSSSRTTPDQNRKSYSSGLSVSSNTSYNSIRTSTGSLQPRLSQSFSACRLPTPKPRNLHSSAATEEEVPPVPAIPKAYESPKEQIEHPLFAIRKSSLPLDTSSAASSSTAELFPAAALQEPFRSDGEDRRRRIRGGEGPEGESKSALTSSVSKKNLQPLRLPPLNLLPLSTPTIAKVKALQEPSPSAEEGGSTPPPKRNQRATPSTPMTASKANFFKPRRDDDSLHTASHMRSTSSTQLAGSDTSLLREGSDSSSGGPAVDSSRLGQQAHSPFISTSLPKSSGDFSQLRPKNSGEYGPSTELRSTRLNGPRAQTSVKLVKNETPTQSSSPVELDTPSSASSLRRKLSLSWRRSSSKASHAATERGSEYPTQTQKHDNMPPPKLPASATWSGSAVPSPSPSIKSTSQLEAKRRKSSISNFTNGHDRTKSDSWDTNTSAPSPKKDTAVYEPSSARPPVTRSGPSILSPMHKILSSKTSFSSLKSRNMDADLDADDFSAEEEMRRFASRRKDFELAAAEVDNLRKRATPKERFSPTDALRMANLNIFERGEIVDYKDIYFCGTQNAKKHVGDLSAQVANFGYDDDRGDYTIVNGDHLAYRYEIIDILGKGSFGQVVRCVDHKSGGLVAVKIIRNKKRFHQQALVEVNILQKLREWDPYNKHSMVSFTQSFYFRGHLCISTELLGMNLYEFIKSNDFRGFSLKLIRRFTKQLLSSLVLLKNHRVIHCDLKPENVLLAHPVHSEIKVIDFGSSCFENEKVYTYIQSRFYRSPEVILGMAYGLPIDMWSLGCILAELYTGYPIFPGENEQEQLACIMEVFGPPEKHLIEKSTRKKLFFDSLGKPRLTVSSKGRRRRPSSKSLQQALKCDDDAFLDFISRCLRWDPERRMKPDEAMYHEFITGLKKTRNRLHRNNTDSPVKRFNNIQTPSGARPLPEPPVTSFKNGQAVRGRDNVSSNSPVKPVPAKRHSAMNSTPLSVNAKRTSTGATIGSNLPRVTTRSASGKGEPALFNATASTVSSSITLKIFQGDCLTNCLSRPTAPMNDLMLL
ncbi:hypothetical protein FGG08_000782 [Glutinoglossum americanum]|uniref:dual-specificity kinase n=1 Tax=Glutinoglossum americanum TaxID=1670608 RepID=A0A9P8ICE0_9PEZI|nr:hypothetical protein FGG08_000782 [Glutinoglossum americanum]